MRAGGLGGRGGGEGRGSPGAAAGAGGGGRAGAGARLQLHVGSDGVDRARVGGAHRARVRARLEHILAHALEAVELPLVHGAVHPRRHEARVVGRPRDRPHLAVVAAEVAVRLARVRRVDLDRVAVDGGEPVAAGREAALGAPFDRKLLVRPDVVHQQIHQPQLVAEPTQHVEPRRVERDRAALLREDLAQVGAPVDVVPDPDRAVGAARRNERLADARVEARHLRRVEALREWRRRGVTELRQNCAQNCARIAR